MGRLIRYALLVFTLAALAPVPSLAAQCLTGEFRASAGPDVASRIEITEDGRFRYFLSTGALDEWAEGQWTCEQGDLRLTTLPRPKPAEFRLESARVHDAAAGEEPPFALHVTWPDGKDIPAVDFRIAFEEGEERTGYTQADGWFADLAGRTPRSIQLSEPFHGTTSPVFQLPPAPKGGRLEVRILLLPNDMGVVDFDAAPVRQEGTGLILNWRGNAISYLPVRQ
ncbi:hypothetical protein [Sphingobium lignivorans]|uniref:Uncharacterized protein n=1 Tax=Sphingobium lignivorans TaxID=2735886 RepID=A0ABR6NG09_9SPHN|nr:hypothetical protein [Sphingobium lignivorans]MBB5985567.1 hypothetical protein [Sphingobium lignivorans]